MTDPFYECQKLLNNNLTTGRSTADGIHQLVPLSSIAMAEESTNPLVPILITSIDTTCVYMGMVVKLKNSH